MTTTRAGLSPPEIGDFAPNFNLPDQDGKPFVLRADRIAGRPVLIVFAPADADGAMLGQIRDALTELKALGAVTVLTRPAAPPDNAQFLRQFDLAIPAVSDSSGRLRDAYGLADAAETRLVLLSPNQRIQAFEIALAPVLERLRRDAENRQNVQALPHPPVLLVPEVLNRAECRRLIDLYESPGWPTRSVGEHLQEKGNYKIEINDYGRVDRIDFVIQDPQTRAFLDQRIGRRVIPEILKAFQYRVTNRERFHIARYEGSRGGFQHGHRDNPTPELAHRRFALSLNLNTEEHEGGALRFPEYGDQRYRAETGTALIFSSSLLHEVLEVTSGRRYVLLSHLYGADDKGRKVGGGR
ncbi:MAG TPA: 2OG-Fe(II) oxygenase [Alphaproteobacteria bacterium]|nr:2OG-Fe(II) oxygenase [Alphaproteobacteria bacterium]